jgi:peptidyl-prolyl cis-trans isomerase D
LRWSGNHASSSPTSPPPKSPPQLSAAAQGAVTAPVRSPLGWHIVRVEAIERTAAKALAAVRGEIETQLTARKQADALAALITRVEDALGGGSSFDEVVRGNGLPVRETAARHGDGRAAGRSGLAAPR